MRITDELRRYIGSHTDHSMVLTSNPPQYTMTYMEDALNGILDRIDEKHTHAVARARRDALYGVNEDEMAELGWVRKDKKVAHAYIEVSPRIDWERIADELDEFANVVREFSWRGEDE